MFPEAALDICKIFATDDGATHIGSGNKLGYVRNRWVLPEAGYWCLWDEIKLKIK